VPKENVKSKSKRGRGRPPKGFPIIEDKTPDQVFGQIFDVPLKDPEWEELLTKYAKHDKGETILQHEARLEEETGVNWKVYEIEIVDPEDATKIIKKRKVGLA
jgi:hypothetical protein